MEKSENKWIERAMAIEAEEFKLHGDIAYNLMRFWFCITLFVGSFSLMPPTAFVGISGKGCGIGG